MNQTWCNRRRSKIRFQYFSVSSFFGKLVIISRGGHVCSCCGTGGDGNHMKQSVGFTWRFMLWTKGWSLIGFNQVWSGLILTNPLVLGSRMFQLRSSRCPGDEHFELGASLWWERSGGDVSNAKTQGLRTYFHMTRVCKGQQKGIIRQDTKYILTYLPHKAVAEVSKDKEPIGRECAEFNWFESQLMSDSNELRFKWFWLSAFVRDFLQNWSFEAQKRSISARLPSKTKLWRSKTKLFCETSFKIEALKLKNEAFLRDFLQKRSFEDQKRNFSARLPSKLKLWSSKTKHFCETSFKNEALKIKNEAFLRDFLQNWIFEAPKQSFSARLPSKMKLSSSKTKHFCETSFKNEALKLKNEAFLRDFLQNWHVEQTPDLRIPIRFNDFQLHASKVLRLPRKSCAEAYELL